MATQSSPAPHYPPLTGPSVLEASWRQEQTVEVTHLRQTTNLPALQLWGHRDFFASLA